MGKTQKPRRTKTYWQNQDHGGGDRGIAQQSAMQSDSSGDFYVPQPHPQSFMNPNAQSEYSSVSDSEQMTDSVFRPSQLPQSRLNTVDRSQDEPISASGGDRGIAQQSAMQSDNSGDFYVPQPHPQSFMNPNAQSEYSSVSDSEQMTDSVFRPSQLPQSRLNTVDRSQDEPISATRINANPNVQLPSFEFDLSKEPIAKTSKRRAGILFVFSYKFSGELTVGPKNAAPATISDEGELSLEAARQVKDNIITGAKIDIKEKSLYGIFTEIRTRYVDSKISVDLPPPSLTFAVASKPIKAQAASWVASGKIGHELKIEMYPDRRQLRKLKRFLPDSRYLKLLIILVLILLAAGVAIRFAPFILAKLVPFYAVGWATAIVLFIVSKMRNNDA